MRFVAVRDGKALLFRRAADDFLGGTWEAGGGKTDGERHEIALEREAFEETGLSIVEIGPVLWKAEFNRKGSYTETTYLAKVKGDIILDPLEHDAFVWHPLGEPLPETISETLESAIEALQAMDYSAYNS